MIAAENGGLLRPESGPKRGQTALEVVVKKVLASFQTANGRSRRHVMCVGERSGSNPEAGNTKPSALRNALGARSALAVNNARSRGNMTLCSRGMCAKRPAMLSREK